MTDQKNIRNTEIKPKIYMVTVIIVVTIIIMTKAITLIKAAIKTVIKKVT